MTSIRSYRDLKVWQKANELALDVFEITDRFPSSYRFDLTSQLRRAVLSVPTNVAEGCASRHSKEFLQFLNIARRSLNETESLLLFSGRRKLLDRHKLDKLEGAVAEIGRMLNGLSKAISSRMNSAPH